MSAPCEDMRRPVTSATVPSSATNAEAASKSPRQTAAAPPLRSAMDRGASAPEARLSSRCRSVNNTQVSKSQSKVAADVAKWAH